MLGEFFGRTISLVIIVPSLISLFYTMFAKRMQLKRKGAKDVQTENPRDYAGIAFAVGLIALGIWVVSETREMSDMGATFPRTIGIAMMILIG